MFMYMRKRFSTTNTARRRVSRQFQLEDLEGRALLSLTPINFPATVTSTPVAVNNKLFFVARDSSHGTQLWETDGTNTVMLTNSSL